MRKYNGEKIIKIITQHIGASNILQEIKEQLMKDVMLPTIKRIADEHLIENTSEITQLNTLQNFIEFNNILCTNEFIDFVKNYNK